MSKAILIIDMPESCDKCKFLNDSYDYPECIITGETRGYTFRIREQKMDKCPLKPLDVSEFDKSVKVKKERS